MDNTVFAQYSVEIQFEDYVNHGPIKHQVIENVIRDAIQGALDNLQLLPHAAGAPAKQNPLVMPMTVTGVKFETDYPDPMEPVNSASGWPHDALAQLR